jgi:hypothetical protein
MTEEGSVDGNSGRRRLADDAVLAAVTLAVVVAVGFAAQVDIDAWLLLVSAVGALAVEVLLSSRPEWVRTVWRRRAARPAAFATALGVALVGVIVAPSLVFSVLWGGLGGYLALAGVVLFVRRTTVGEQLRSLRR